MRLSDFKDEEAIELIGEVIEPAGEIMTDPEVKKLFNEGNKMAIASYILKSHSKATFQVLKIMSGDENYHCNPVSALADVIEVLNDEELVAVFRLQGQTSDAESTGPATTNAE